MTSSGSSAATLFSNEALFLASTGGLTLESFENETATNNSSQTSSLPLTDFTLSSTSSFGVYNTPAFGQAATDGDQFIGSLNEGDVVLNFNQPITTLGINILDFGDFGSGVLTLSNGVDSFTAALPQTDGNTQFFGIVSDTAFTTATLSHDIAGESYGIDEVHYGVPEPASLALISLGAAGFAGRRRLF